MAKSKKADAKKNVTTENDRFEGKFPKAPKVMGLDEEASRALHASGEGTLSRKLGESIGDNMVGLVCFVGNVGIGIGKAASRGVTEKARRDMAKREQREDKKSFHVNEEGATQTA